MRFGCRWMAAALVVPSVVLSGCSEDPEPKLAPPSASPSTSPTPSSEPTRQPWEKKSNAGAVAFVRHWIHAVVDASNSGESATFASLGAKTCETCTSIADYIDEVYSEGGSIRVGQWRLLQVSEVAPGTQSEPMITTRVRKPEEVVRRTNPGKTVRIPSSRFNLVFTLTWNGGAWLAKTVDQIQS